MISNKSVDYSYRCLAKMVDYFKSEGEIDFSIDDINVVLDGMKLIINNMPISRLMKIYEGKDIFNSEK